MLVSLCHGFDTPDWQANVLRLLDVFVDGLARESVMHASERTGGSPA